MKELAEVLAEHPFFADMPDGERELVAGCGELAVYEAGDYLAQAGDDAEHFFLIRHGKVGLEISAPGRGSFRFETVGEGEIVGWSWLFEPHRSQFDSRAIEQTRVVRFDGKCLRDKCEADHALGYDIMKRFARVLVRRFSSTRLQLMDVHARPEA